MLTVRAPGRQFVSIQLLPVLVQREEGRTRRKEPVNFAKQDASEHPRGAQAGRTTVLPPLCARAWYVAFVCWCSMEEDLGHMWNESLNSVVWLCIIGTNPLPYMAPFSGWLTPPAAGASVPEFAQMQMVRIVDMSVHSVYIFLCTTEPQKIPRVFKSIWH